MGTDKADSRDVRTEEYEKHLKVPIETVRSDLYNLAVRIQYFRELFTEDASRVDLLNKIASTFFHVVEQALFTEIVVRFSRVTDASTMGKHKNLSLHFIFEEIEGLELEDSSNLIATLRKRLREIGRGVNRIRKLRNKVIAHRDLKHALQTDSELGESMEKIEETYEHIGSFMNDIELFFTDSTYDYSTEFFAPRNGAMCLIDALERSIGEMGQGDEM